MASKNKKRPDGQKATPGGGGGLRQEVERLVAKDRLKDAVKQAKLCYKAEETPENHRLLERVYLLRADQLRKNAMPSAAREVAQHLLDFGITDTALLEGAAGLLVAVGMASEASTLQGRIDDPEARDRLTRRAADEAVLHPDRAAKSAPELRQGASTVRAALDALAAGDEEKASATLRDVSRGSPFSDWRLFVRGLAAYWRRQEPEARASWERLDPERSAARIARTLLVTLAGESPGVDGPGRARGANLEALERRVFGEPVLGRLEELRVLVVEGKWRDAIRRLASLRFHLRSVDPKLAERLTRVLYHPLIKACSDLDYREAKSLVAEFTRGAEPLPMDPRWNRLWAMIWEGPQGELDTAEDYWRAYLKDLETLPALAPEDRTLAQALVLKHLGESHLEDADAFDEEGRAIDPDLRESRNRAVACLEESLRLAPAHRETYRVLLDAYRDWKQPEPAAAVARRLLERFPDDFDAWFFLADHHFRRDEPAPALEAVTRVRELRPLDRASLNLEWSVRVLDARQLALKGQWDEGRAELDAAERLSPDGDLEYDLLVRRATFELKAGQADRSEALIADALGRIEEPTALWLALLIESIRFKLPKPERDRFEAKWLGALPKRVRSETAGRLAGLMGAFLASDRDYPGRGVHVNQVSEYLRRTTRIKYRLEDLIVVYAFLEDVPKEQALLDKLVDRGLKLFPKAPEVLTLAAWREIKKGPFKGGNLTVARKHLEKALEQAQASGDPKHAELVPKIQQGLAIVGDLLSGPMGFPFGGFGGAFGPMFGGMGGFPVDPFDFFDDDFDDDEFEYDEAPPRPAPAPRPAGGGKARKSKKKKKK